MVKKKLMDITINNFKLTVGSVYGPNINENITVFDDLLNGLSEMDLTNTVLGGDWNCTWDSRNVELNIDCLNMVSIPSKRRSEKLINICNQKKLTDPFRCLFPNKREFTYVPAALEHDNR